jgi:ATP-binding cassette subfamily C (CFTR/MRP) protein 1
MSCLPSLDREFGPRVDQCRRAFDFTQLFEECIFSIAPSVLLLLAATVRTFFRERSRPRVTGTSVLVLKLVVLSCFCAVQSTILILRCLDSAGRTPTTIAAAVTAVTDAVAMACLSTREHSRSIRPLWVLEVYLFFTLILDGARTRTAWLMGQDDIYPILTTTGIAIKAAILLLELRGKAGLSLEDKNRSPEERSGVIEQSLLWWLVGLVRTGYRKILTLSDLFPLTDEMRSEVIGANFGQAWMRSKFHASRTALLRECRG